MPGLAREIVDMAKRAQRAQHKAVLVPLRAEAASLVMATAGVTFFGWIMVVGAVFLAMRGYDTAAWVAGVAGVLSNGPQIINATKRSLERPTKTVGE